MKRDDCTGLAMGGNKTRKLEFLVGEALQMGCDTLITGGAAQSNHCRQTAAAAAQCGLSCHLALGGSQPADATGSLLLDDLLGAVIHWTGTERKGESIPHIEEQLRRDGRRPYVIPYGGSNAIGALGFVQAVHELVEQLDVARISMSAVVFPSSSGGTQAGLLVGARMVDARFRLIGIGIDKSEPGAPPLSEQVRAIAHAAARRLSLAQDFSDKEITLRDEYVGAGYGVVGDLERRAIRLLAETEGILVDPVYTGRAFGALVDMIEAGEFTAADSVLFWHTGGTPALFSYAHTLQNPGGKY